MNSATIRATYPQRGGWAPLQVGRTVIRLDEGMVYNPDGTKKAISRDIKDFARSLAIRTRNDVLLALDVEGNGLVDIPAGPWQHIDDETFHRVILIADTATEFKLHVSSGPKAFSLKTHGEDSLLHGPPEVINTTIPAGAGALTTILDLTGKDPIQSFSFQIVSGPIGVNVGYDKDAIAGDPEAAVLQTVNRKGYEILNKITVKPTAAHVIPIVIKGEAWRY